MSGWFDGWMKTCCKGIHYDASSPMPHLWHCKCKQVVAVSLYRRLLPVHEGECMPTQLPLKAHVGCDVREASRSCLPTPARFGWLVGGCLIYVKVFCQGQLAVHHVCRMI